MKLPITLMAGMLALGFAATASAQTVVRITGSTAYRGATHNAITHILAPGFTYAYSGASLGGASYAIFSGTVGGNSVIIKTSWSGSVGGVQTVSKGLPVNFLLNTTTQTTGGSANTAAPSGATADATAPDVAMSDTFQSSTIFRSPVLTDIQVGVVPFKWVASKGAPAGLNMTPLLAQALWSNGTAPLALWTGSSTDRIGSGTAAAPNPYVVYATGRDPDSGTRLTAFAEGGIGVNAVVSQYKPTITSGAVTGYQPYPQQTVNGIVFPLGQGGEASGGTLATNMTATTTNSTGFSMTYLSTGDAANAIAGGATEMTWNGVPYSASAVEEGKYTFWGYEHLMYKSTFSGVGKTVADTLANQLINTDATVLLGTMKVSRPTDGGLVSALYF